MIASEFRPSRSPARALSRALPLPAAVAIVAVLCVVLAAALNQYRLYLGELDGLRDLSDYAIGRDFANYWLGGRAVIEDRLDILFRSGPYLAWLRQTFWEGLPFHNWSYPPHYLFLVAPFGLLAYLAAYAAWCTTGLVAIGTVVRAMKLDLPPWLVPGALAPVALVNVLYGQNGLILGALLVGGLWWRDSRPWLAGILLGLLTVKPQLGILVPVLLLLQGNWRTIAGACIAALSLILLSALAFGRGAWSDYVTLVSPLQYQIMTEGIGFFTSMMQTPFRAARALGLANEYAWPIHAAFALAALALAVYAAWRLRDGPARQSATAATIAATFVVSPYAMSYDMVALVCAALIWTASARQGFGAGRGLLAAAVFVLPLVGPYLSALKLPVGPLVVFALCIAIVGDARRACTSGRQQCYDGGEDTPAFHRP